MGRFSPVVLSEHLAGKFNFAGGASDGYRCTNSKSPPQHTPDYISEPLPRFQLSSSGSPQIWPKAFLVFLLKQQNKDDIPQDDIPQDDIPQDDIPQDDILANNRKRFYGLDLEGRGRPLVVLARAGRRRDLPVCRD
ncbi:hypothetical protein BaRGS_00002484, partial [Batillaria attramentaria]